MTKLLAFHGSQATKDKVTPAAHIRSALRLGAIRVVPETGEVFGRRGQRLGCLSTRGYLVASLHLNGKRKQIKLHQAVWLAAGRKFRTGAVIDHINRDKADNRIENLRLATPSENSRNRRCYLGAENPAAKIDAIIAARIRASYIPRIRSYPRLAEQFGISASLVSKIIRGEYW